ncbi:unnamed protein product [Echinostoma caproni]|uniref:RL10P_insert domain-containing protein n=1 Tax=Echinostoma caproni TaxID=27848 RepID=A0A183B1A6_9TREM|nr:unnamed protein product [Echinostoma caproni]
MEPYLRQLGLPVKLVRGIVHLTEEFTVCQKDEALKPEQCRILVKVSLANKLVFSASFTSQL